MSDQQETRPAATEQWLAELTGEEMQAEVQAAARRAVAFLSACVEGQVAEATIGERIIAAQVLLEHSSRLPDLLGELAAIADMASEGNVAAVVSLLE